VNGPVDKRSRAGRDRPRDAPVPGAVSTFHRLTLDEGAVRDLVRLGDATFGEMLTLVVPHSSDGRIRAAASHARVALPAGATVPTCGTSLNARGDPRFGEASSVAARKGGALCRAPTNQCGKWHIHRTRPVGYLETGL
jgi:hypothetical protein